MKLPTYRRLYRTDYDQKDQALIDKLSITVNNAFDVLFQALNNNLTFADNFSATIKDMQITVDAKGVPTTTATFALSFTGLASFVQIVKVTNLTNSTALLNGSPFPLYQQNNNNIQILQVTGLVPGNTYLVRFIAYQ